ncbi:MAG TPA: DUF1835 domain-containing protein [Pyrinomonadaceae bacterium]|jgi:hypothetical protein|nr:DUF1835 domain-containing protein [Pyrinomonadaceae bacterium]
MIFHVLPGDAQVEEFSKADIPGKIIVCREALIYGPIDAADLDQFWNERARFIVGEYGEDEIAYHDNVAGELAKLLEVEPEDEVSLWFEYELFCSVNMWFCLSLLRETEATVYRVEPLGRDVEMRWDGFGGFTADEMKAAYALRTHLSCEEVELGAKLWNAYRLKDAAALKQIAANCETDCFPYLNEVAAAAAGEDIRPIEMLKEIRAGGEKDFNRIFMEFKRRAGVYGYGDLQVKRLLDQLGSS